MVSFYRSITRLTHLQRTVCLPFRTEGRVPSGSEKWTFRFCPKQMSCWWCVQESSGLDWLGNRGVASWKEGEAGGSPGVGWRNLSNICATNLSGKIVWAFFPNARKTHCFFSWRVGHVLLALVLCVRGRRHWIQVCSEKKDGIDWRNNDVELEWPNCTSNKHDFAFDERNGEG